MKNKFFIILILALIVNSVKAQIFNGEYRINNNIDKYVGTCHFETSEVFKTSDV